MVLLEALLIGGATACYGFYRQRTTNATNGAAASSSNQPRGTTNDGQVEVTTSSNNKSASDSKESPATTTETNGLPIAAGTTKEDQEGFVSQILLQMWGYMNAAVSKSIQETLEPQFKDALPGSLSNLRFVKVDLGDVPFSVANILVHEVDETNHTLRIDLDARWEGDCDIKLKASSLGSFKVKSVNVNGRLSILLKPLVKTLSFFDAVQVAFVNPPKIDLDFGKVANAVDKKMLKQHLHAILFDNVKSKMVLPNRILTKMNAASSFLDIYQGPIGVCSIHLKRGSGFEVEHVNFGKDDIPDVYVELSLGGRMCRSEVIKDKCNPVWNETMDFVLFDHAQIFEMEVFDRDSGSFDADDYLGSAKGSITEILASGGRKEVRLLQSDKPTGAVIKLGCDMLKFTSDLESLSSEPSSDSEICGILTVIVTQAFDLPLNEHDVCCYVKVKCGKQEFVTSTVVDLPGVDPLNPFFDKAFLFPLTNGTLVDGKIKDVCLDLMNGEDSLGSIRIKHMFLEEAPDHTLREQTSIGTTGASLEYLVRLCGLKSSKSLADAVVSGNTGRYSIETDDMRKEASQQMARVTIQKASGFQVQKKRFKRDDIPDVYCITKFGSSPTIFRTSTIKDNVAPAWNEFHEYLFEDYDQVIHVDLFDENSGKLTKDDYYGCARVAVGKILLGTGSLDIEVRNKGKPTGILLTLECQLV